MTPPPSSAELLAEQAGHPRPEPSGIPSAELIARTVTTTPKENPDMDHTAPPAHGSFADWQVRCALDELHAAGLSSTFDAAAAWKVARTLAGSDDLPAAVEALKGTRPDWFAAGQQSGTAVRSADKLAAGFVGGNYVPENH